MYCFLMNLCLKLILTQAIIYLALTIATTFGTKNINTQNVRNKKIKGIPKLKTVYQILAYEIQTQSSHSMFECYSLVHTLQSVEKFVRLLNLYSKLIVFPNPAFLAFSRLRFFLSLAVSANTLQIIHFYCFNRRLFLICQILHWLQCKIEIVEII